MSEEVEELKANLERLRLENERLRQSLSHASLFAPTPTGSERAYLLATECLVESKSNLPSPIAAGPPEPPILSIVVMGASGDLAQKKTYPALFSLWRQGLIPRNTVIMGFARTDLKPEDFHKKISQKFDMSRATEEQKREFLTRCFYFRGSYDNDDDYAGLRQDLLAREADARSLPAEFDKDATAQVRRPSTSAGVATEPTASVAPKSPGAPGGLASSCADSCETKPGAQPVHRVFYMAIPPSVFLDVAKGVDAFLRPTCGWTRVIIEKPFGKDYESARELATNMSKYFTEDEMFRIDHYLGKEMVQNLMILRFANRVFEPLWNHNHIETVTITFKEDFGIQGRGSYFDEYGIIRDVMQNHLLQILALLGMEPPVTLSAEDVRDEKVKFLRALAPISLDEVVVGQYGVDPSGKEPAYLDDPTVAKDSKTPTFAMAVLHAFNSRWHGTRFILKCGKGLNERKAEVRIQFKTPHNNLFKDLLPNELVLRVQPNDAIYLKMITKEPGLIGGLRGTELDFTVASRFPQEAKEQAYDAYERLIWDVTRDDHNLFVRSDELLESWRIFTPVLHELDEKQIKPIQYDFGSRGPAEADALAQRVGFVAAPGTYSWQPPVHDK